MKRKIVILTGPTAVGKSDLAVKLAKRFSGEVVSADSMQIYKGMDVGTGKITEAETEGIKHRMIDVVTPDESYSVGRFVSDASREINNIPTDKIPIVVGGTGLYVNALVNGMNLSGSAADAEIRNKWKEAVKDHGLDFVYNQLAGIDPKSAEKIDRNDEKRIIRALEIYEATGKPKSSAVTSSDCEYDYILIVLTSDRETLYRRINARVCKMFESGLIDEVKRLTQYENCQSMQAIGYKQTIAYLKAVNEKQSLAALVDEVCKLSRNYAKRQMTFFRGIRSPRKCYIDAKREDLIFNLTQEFLNKKDN